MAHLFVPQDSIRALPVFFNVDAVVGAQPAQNKREDVLFVQFALEIVAQQPRTTTKPEVLVACKLVKPTGIIDAPTIAAIRAFQAFRKHSVPDARVSPARGGYSYDGVGFYTIAHLNNSLQERCVDVWPRIDKIANCPAELRTMVIRTVAGTH